MFVLLTLTALVLPLSLSAGGTAFQLESKIDALFAEVGRSDVPGVAAAVVQEGRIVYQNAFGMADLERGVRLSPASVFETGAPARVASEPARFAAYG